MIHSGSETSSRQRQLGGVFLLLSQLLAPLTSLLLKRLPNKTSSIAIDGCETICPITTMAILVLSGN